MQVISVQKALTKIPNPASRSSEASGAKHEIVAMQRSVKGKSKIVGKCDLSLTLIRPVHLIVTELAVIAFPDGQATLQETAPGVSVDQVVGATEAELIAPVKVPEMLL